jgi:DNA polymerase
MTIHDEIVAEVPIDSPLGIDKLLECMRRTPWWAEGMGFTLAAEGYEGAYYKK